MNTKAFTGLAFHHTNCKWINTGWEMVIMFNEGYLVVDVIAII